MPIQSLQSDEEFTNFIKKKTLSVVLFSAPWALSLCEKPREFMKESSSNPEYNEQVLFGEIEAEPFPEICLNHKIEAVPTLLLFRNGEIVERVNGTSDLANKIKANMSKIQSSTEFPPPVTNSNGNQIKPNENQSLEDRLKFLISKDPVVLFIKGTPDMPRCGFSRTIIEMIRETGIPFGTFDILEDEEVRQGLKTFSNWQTYPQVYVKGELIGGLDIIKELKESGDLIPSLKGE